MGLIAIQEQIIEICKEIADFKAVHGHPVFDLGRDLPALLVLYTGFTQSSGPNRSTEVRYAWDITIYLPLEGRDHEKLWAEVFDLAEKTLAKFRSNPGLNKADSHVWWSTIESGESIIEIPNDPLAKPKWIGHKFRLIARIEEE